KGFGFIAPSTGGKDIFVHIRALERSGLDVLADGEQVRVTVRQGVKGPERSASKWSDVEQPGVRGRGGPIPTRPVAEAAPFPSPSRSANRV
uniref:cold-shock protein n=1 Tax=Azospirillum brasilense TaxID=192 RepID=UPI0018C8E8DA